MKAAATDEPRVTIQALADQLGVFHGMGDLANQYGVTPEEDWAGRWVIRESEARKIVDGARASEREHAEKWSAYEAYVQDRERRRHQAGAAAYSELVERNYQTDLQRLAGMADFVTVTGVYRTGIISGETRAEAREARAIALTVFDRREPLLEFTEWREGT